MRRRGPAEGRSDDEVRTSLVPDRREGKTKRIKWMCLLLAVLKLIFFQHDNFKCSCSCNSAYRLQYVMKGVSRGAKRWWGPHISSPWLKGMENEKDRVKALTVYGIEPLLYLWILPFYILIVAITLTAYGMRRRVPAEERSDDEVRTSLVSDLRENEKDRVNVPTACGIETQGVMLILWNIHRQLQQHLPLTVCINWIVLNPRVNHFDLLGGFVS